VRNTETVGKKNRDNKSLLQIEHAPDKRVEKGIDEHAKKDSQEIIQALVERVEELEKLCRTFTAKIESLETSPREKSQVPNSDEKEYDNNEQEKR